MAPIDHIAQNEKLIVARHPDLVEQIVESLPTSVNVGNDKAPALTFGHLPRLACGVAILVRQSQEPLDSRMEDMFQSETLY